MNFKRGAEHLLQKLYIHLDSGLEKNGDRYSSETVRIDQKEVENLKEAEEELIKQECACFQGKKLVITEKGKKMAEDLTRRYRLAERLFHDLLHIEDAEAASSACEIEHILSPAVTDSICALLGHPPICPHGKPIPPGSCCERKQSKVQPIVMSLGEMPIGVWGKITFITSKIAGRIEKISSLGITSGSTIKVIQKKPSVLVETAETHIALENEIADEIFIRLK